MDERGDHFGGVRNSPPLTPKTVVMKRFTRSTWIVCMLH